MSLANYLLGQSRASVLGVLLLRPESALHVREIARLTGTSPGSLHRELRALSEHGLLLRQEVGRQVQYRANVDSPVFEELAGLLRKTAGLADVLRDALAPLESRIGLAFVYGSIAAGTARANSDVDLMVLGSVRFSDLALALAQARESLGREVNATAMTTVEFARRYKARDGFARSVMAGSRIWLIGTEDDLAELAAHRKT